MKTKIFSKVKRGFERRSGFSLLEIMASLVILTILAGGIFATVSFSKRMAIRAEEKLIASSLVEQKLNELRQKGAVNVPSGTSAASLGSALSGGTITTVVTPPLAVGDPNREKLKEVMVTVSWTDRFGQERSESAMTVLYQA